MRKYIGKYILLFVICLAMGISAWLFISAGNENAEGRRNTLMNRVDNELSSKDSDDIDAGLAVLLSSNDWEKEYGKKNVPSDIRFIKADNGGASYSHMGDGDSVWSISQDGVIKGFLVFSFRDDHVAETIIISEFIIAACFVITMLFFIFSRVVS